MKSSPEDGRETLSPSHRDDKNMSTPVLIHLS